MGLFNSGGLFGIGMAYAAGPALSQALEGFVDEATIWFPADGWRLTFIVVGAVGLLFAALILRLPEPRKDLGVVATSQPKAREPLMPYLKRSSSFTIPLLVSLVLLNLYAVGYLTWQTPYFTRTHGWELAEVGKWLGISVLGAGITGSLLGGWITSVITRKTGRDSAMLVSGIAVALLAPLAVLTPLSPNGEIAMSLLAMQLTLAFSASATLPTVLVNTSPPHLRARFFATNLFFGNLFGAGVGPTIFALITDYVLRDESKLYLSLSIGAAVIFVPVLILLWRTAHQYQSALIRAEPASAALGAQI